MVVTRHEARGAAREPDGETPGLLGSISEFLRTQATLGATLNPMIIGGRLKVQQRYPQ